MLLFWQRQEKTSLLVPAMDMRFFLTWFFLGMQLLFYLLLLNCGVRLLCEAEQMLCGILNIPYGVMRGMLILKCIICRPVQKPLVTNDSALQSSPLLICVCIATSIQCSSSYLDLFACSMCCSHLTYLIQLTTLPLHSTVHESLRQGYRLRHLEMQCSIAFENFSVCSFYFVIKWSMKISQVDCGSYSVYLYLPLSPSKLCPSFFFRITQKKHRCFDIAVPYSIAEGMCVS